MLIPILKRSAFTAVQGMQSSKQGIHVCERVLFVNRKYTKGVTFS